MATSSILGGTHAPIHPSGADADALGPSDSSDTGSDARYDGAAADGSEADSAPDIAPDRIGILPDDAADTAASIDDPTALAVEQLASDDLEDDLDDGDDEE